MSFKAKLRIDGREYNILSLAYSLDQEVDDKGMPSTILKIGKINIQLESTGDTVFFEWVCNSFLRKDGTISLIKRDTDATLKEIKFLNAYLISYKESFAAENDNPTIEHLVLSAEEIQSGTGSYSTKWE